jgi:hypothetical protein
MKKEVNQNLITYTVFLLLAWIGIIYGRSIQNEYQFIRIWDVNNLLLMLLGVPFLFLQSKARLPEFWSENIIHKNRFLIPALIGITFGLLDILVVKVMMHPEPYTELPPFLQPFPYSLFLYFSGAFEVEVFYRLIPLTLFLLVGTWYHKGKFYQAFFLAGSILTALREPLEQLPEGNVYFIGYSLLTGFLMNYLQALWYQKAGFLASLTIRLSHYLCWHIILGMYVEFIELS